MTGGNFLFAVQLSNDPAALALGEVYYIAALGLAIEQTAAANEAQISTLEGLRGKLGAVGPSALGSTPFTSAILDSRARTNPTLPAYRWPIPISPTPTYKKTRRVRAGWWQH